MDRVSGLAPVSGTHLHPDERDLFWHVTPPVSHRSDVYPQNHTEPGDRETQCDPPTACLSSRGASPTTPSTTDLGQTFKVLSSIEIVEISIDSEKINGLRRISRMTTNKTTLL